MTNHSNKGNCAGERETVRSQTGGRSRRSRPATSRRDWPESPPCFYHTEAETHASIIAFVAALASKYDRGGAAESQQMLYDACWSTSNRGASHARGRAVLNYLKSRWPQHDPEPPVRDARALVDVSDILSDVASAYHDPEAEARRHERQFTGD